MTILVSACLLGENCKYNGGNNLREHVVRLGQTHELIPVCPEVAAGLGIPRIPIEIRDGEVVRSDGVSVNDAIRAAVADILAKLPQDIALCVLKARSPTCGNLAIQAIILLKGDILLYPLYFQPQLFYRTLAYPSFHEPIQHREEYVSPNHRRSPQELYLTLPNFLSSEAVPDQDRALPPAQDSSSHLYSP